MVDEHKPDIIIGCETHLDETYTVVKCSHKVIPSLERIDVVEVEECFWQYLKVILSLMCQ